MSLSVFIFQTIVPLTATAKGGFTMEPFMYLGGGLITVVVGLLLMQIFIYVPVHKKLDKYKPNKVPAIVKNELEYIEYLQWVSKEELVPHFSKKIVKVKGINKDKS